MTEATKKTVLKVGDYVSSPSTVYRRVVAVLTDGPIPVYGLVGPKHGERVTWESQYELDEEGATASKGPDYKLWAGVQAGDIIKTGHTDDRDFCRVLSRVGDVVLLSDVPDTKKVKEVTDLSKALADLTDGAINPMDSMTVEDKKMLRKMASTTHASKVATDWKTIIWLAQMNWQLISE